MRSDLIFLFLMAVLSSCTTENALRRKANSYSEAKAYDSALFYYNVLTDLNPTNPDYQYEIGRQFLGLKSYDSAWHYFRAAIKAGKKDSDSFFLLGYSLYKTGNPHITYFEAAIESDSSFQQAWYYGALSHIEEGNFKEARYFIDKSINLDSSDYKSWLTRSRLWVSGDSFNLTMALNDINKSISIRDSSFSRYMRSAALYHLGDTIMAIREVNKAIELQDDLSIARLLRADISFSQGDTISACFEIDTLKTLNHEIDLSKYSKVCDYLPN